MAVGTAVAGAGVGIAAGLTALWAYANGDDVGDSIKNLWDSTKEKLNIAADGQKSIFTKEFWKNVGKGMGNILDKLGGNGESIHEKIQNANKEIINKLENGEEPPKEEPPKEENPYGKLPVSPQGAIAGAMTGINNSDNNTIQDTTNQNIEQNIGSMFDDYLAKMEEYQKKQWEREDTAYQRAVEDARLAGINVGALGGSIQPATSTTNIMSSASSTQFQEIAEFIQQEIDNNFSGNENDKDRLTSALQMMLMMALMNGKK